MLLTLGDPAGVGPDCVLRAFDAHPREFADITVIASPHWLKERAREIGMRINIRESSEPACQPGLIHDHAIPADNDPPDNSVLHCWPAGINNHHPVSCGRPDCNTAGDVIHCIQTAAETCLDGRARSMITGPIDKSVLREAGFSFPGHTEFLAHLADTKQVVMMLASDQLRVSLLTTHMAIKEVPAQLSVEKTVNCLRIINHELKNRFDLENPHIALCSLNPHAGEKGIFGREELEILIPAVQQAQANDINIEGPLPADTLFSENKRSNFDTIVCCYHDQGLIPIKALSFGGAVNITLGLPFVRTSPDHGTGLDRAGSPNVSYSSLLKAIRMARSTSSLHYS